MARPPSSLATAARWTLAGALVAARAAAQGEEPSVSPPVVIKHEEAVYPPGAGAIAGALDVSLFVSLDDQGQITSVTVAQSSGVPSIDDAAVAAVQKWAFAPATRDGKPVRAKTRVTVHFTPPPPPSPPPSPAPQPTPPPQAPPPKAAPKAEIEDVTVRGRLAPPVRGASDVRFERGALANVPAESASDVLKQAAPGLLLTNEGGEGHAEQIFLRGFDAREGQDIEISVDGVPINESGNLHGNGYADTHFIIPELVKSLRVLEGPYDPRQGNYAVAGSADYHLGLTERGLRASYTLGSYGTHRALVLWGPKGQSEGTFGGAEVHKTDGYGQNRDAVRGTAMAQYEGKIGEKGTYRITGTAYGTTYHSAGVIRDDDFRSGRKGFYDTYDFGQGGDSSRFSLAGDVEARSESTTLTQQLFVIARGMRLREDFTGFLLDTQKPLQTPHGQRGDLLDLDVTEGTLGARGSLRTHARAFGQRQELEVGYFARGDLVDGTQQRLTSGTLIPYETETSLTSKLVDVGLYGDAALRPVSWLTLRGGARADVFTFDVNDRCAVKDPASPSKTSPPINESCVGASGLFFPRESNQRAGTASVAALPRATAVFGPLQHLTLSTSVGQGVRSIDPSYITQDVRTPFASITSYEAGGVYARDVKDVDLVVRSVFFQTHVDRDLVFSEAAGRNVLGLGTTRTGWMGAVRATGSIAEVGFDLAANVTLVRSVYDDTHLLVAYAPNVVVRSDLAVFRDLPWKIMQQKVRATIGAGLTFVGERPLPYGDRSQVILTLDATASVRWSAFELALSATNILDRRYRLGEYNYVSSFDPSAPPTLVPQRHFTAGPPLMLFATFAVRFEGV